MTVSKSWCELDIDSDNLDSYTIKHDDWNLLFAHHKEEDKIYPLTLTEIADAQLKDQELKVYFKKQAERGFAKEASVYFPYLDSVLFCIIHYATLPFRHSTIPPSRHSAIPLFRHSVILPFCHSAIPPFCHSAIPLQYAITRCMYRRRC
jgi:hypothetical protein